MSSVNNSPKGYFLLFGINNFEGGHAKSLSKCVDDVYYWYDLLSRYYYYNKDSSVILTNSNATHSKFVCAMIKLAEKAVSGDLVTIAISTHGGYSRGNKTKRPQHLFLTYKDFQEIHSDLFNFLLKLFRKGVRITVLFDICESQGFTSYSDNIDLSEDLEIKLGIAIATLDSTIQNRVLALARNNQNIAMSASILEYASVSRSNNALDGWLSKFTKDEIFKGWGWWQYDAFQYRDALEKCFDKHIVNNYFPGQIKRLCEIGLYLPNLRQTLVNAKKAYNYSFFSDVVKAYMKHPWVFFIPLLEDAIAELSVFMSKQKDSSIYQSDLEFLDNFKNIYEIHVNGMPHVNFYGVSNESFKEQYIFTI